MSVLNHTAATVWELATDGHDARAITTELADRFDRPAPSLARDVDAALTSLAAEGLLEGADPPDGPSVAGDDGATQGEAPAAPTPPPGTTPATVTMTRRALHHRVAIEADPATHELLAPLLAHLPDDDGPIDAHLALAEVHGDGGVARWTVLRDGRPSSPPGTLDTALGHLLWRMNHEAIEAEHDWLLLHAGAARGRSGAVVVAGEPDAGKSTLTGAMAQAGLAYLTDEASAVDGDLRVMPYPKPLTLDGRSRALLDLAPGTANHVAPGRLGQVAGHEPVPLAAAVLPERRPGARASLTRLDQPAAALALAAVTFNLAATGVRGLEVLAGLAATVPVYRLVLDDVREAALAVVDLAGGRGTPPDGVDIAPGAA